MDASAPEPTHTRMMRELAEQAIPNTTDLWPRIRVRILALQKIRQRQARLRRIWMIGSGALVILGSMLLIQVPGSRAAAIAFLQQVGFVLVEPAQIEPQMTAVEMEPAHFSERFLSLQEAQRRVPFPIRLPRWVPPGLRLAGVWAETHRQTATTNEHPMQAVVILVYRPSKQLHSTSQGLQVTISSGTMGARIPVPPSEEQQAMVRGQTATYIHGAWGTPAEDATGEVQWNAKADVAWLSWQQQGRIYTISAYGLGMGRDELLRLAESIPTK